MNNVRELTKDVGEGILAVSDSHILSGLSGASITFLVSSSSSAKKAVSQMNFFDLSSLFGVIVGAFLFIITVIVCTVFLEVLLKRLGNKTIWFSEHKLGEPIGKTNFNIIEFPVDKNSEKEIFGVKILNKESKVAIGVSVCIVIMASEENEKPNFLGRTSVSWIDKNTKTVLREIDIDSKKDAEIPFIEIDKHNKTFTVKTSTRPYPTFEVGNYSFSVDFEGFMEGKQFKGKKSGTISFTNEVVMKFNLKKRKVKRGWVSLVDADVWETL